MAAELSTEVLVNYAILYGYFAIILACFGAVIASILGRSPAKDTVLSGRPFVFIRCAVGGLIATWYCELVVRGGRNRLVAPKLRALPEDGADASHDPVHEGKLHRLAGMPSHTVQNSAPPRFMKR
jgi:hypothetical protein